MQVEVKNTGKTPEQMVAELQNFKRRLPAGVGNIAVRFFKDNITERQGFLNSSLELWQKGRRMRFRQSHDLLIGKCNLVRGINYSVSGDTVIVNVIGTAAKYAEIQNAGGTITVTDKMRRFFWAKYFEIKGHAEKKYFKENGDKRNLRDTKQLRKRNNDLDEFNYWYSLALAKKVTIPARKFIGNSIALDNEIMKYIEGNLDNIFNK
ncbi:MAG TPA: hypothetical protein PK355_04390 [Chitinophagales bacterium]|nr:hypothetical protein [Chitinophagales bacterium]